MHGHFGGVLNGGYKALAGCSGFSCLVESCSVIDGSPDNRQTQRNIYSSDRIPFALLLVPVESEQLERDMALVMVHGNYSVIGTAVCLGKEGICRQRAVGVYRL